MIGRIGAPTTEFGWDTARGWRTSEGPSGTPFARVCSYSGTGRVASLDPSSGVTTDTSYLYEGLSLLSLERQFKTAGYWMTRNQQTAVHWTMATRAG